MPESRPELKVKFRTQNSAAESPKAQTGPNEAASARSTADAVAGAACQSRPRHGALFKQLQPFLIGHRDPVNSIPQLNTASRFGAQHEGHSTLASAPRSLRIGRPTHRRSIPTLPPHTSSRLVLSSKRRRTSTLLALLCLARQHVDRCPPPSYARLQGASISSESRGSGTSAVLTSWLQRMQTDPPAGVSASPVPDNVMTW
jgi:hypothetical protein